MFSLNYLINAGMILSFILAASIINRKDIAAGRALITIMLFICAFYCMSYMLFTFNMFSPARNLWFFLYIITAMLFRYMFVFYIFEMKIKNPLLKVIIPVLIIFVTIISATYLIYNSGINAMNSNADLLIFIANDSLRLISAVLWLVIAVILIVSKRMILVPVAVLGTLISVSIMINWHFNIYNAIILVFSVYTPPALYFDFLRNTGHRMINSIYNINAAENSDFGIIMMENSDKFYRNRYMDSILIKESVQFEQWMQKNRRKFENLPKGKFVKMELGFNENIRYFYVLKQVPGKYIDYSSLFYLFDASRNEMLEKLTARYTELLARETGEKIYHYDYRNKLADVTDFMKGFSHNSFNLISVITTGMQYVSDLMDKMEKEIFASGSLDKKKEQIKTLYYSMENTLNLSESGVKKLFETFQMLNERTAMISQDGNSIININQSIKQELFFFVGNTLFQYSINLKTHLSSKEKTISFKYDTFATIIHDIIKFIIEEMEKEREHILTVRTDVNEINNTEITLSVSSRHFNAGKIDSIINDSVFSLEEHYAPLINAVILCKSHNIAIKRIEGNELTIKLIFNE